MCWTNRPPDCTSTTSAKLLTVLHRLVDAGNTVVVIEHNLDVIKTADYIIDLGPEGGPAGGQIVAQGTPEEVARVTKSYTGKYLAEVLPKRKKKAHCEEGHCEEGHCEEGHCEEGHCEEGHCEEGQREEGQREEGQRKEGQRKEDQREEGHEATRTRHPLVRARRPLPIHAVFQVRAPALGRDCPKSSFWV